MSIQNFASHVYGILMDTYLFGGHIVHNCWDITHVSDLETWHIMSVTFFFIRNVGRRNIYVFPISITN